MTLFVFCRSGPTASRFCNPATRILFLVFRTLSHGGSTGNLSPWSYTVSGISLNSPIVTICHLTLLSGLIVPLLANKLHKFNPITHFLHKQTFLLALNIPAHRLEVPFHIMFNPKTMQYSLRVDTCLYYRFGSWIVDYSDAFILRIDNRPKEL